MVVSLGSSAPRLLSPLAVLWIVAGFSLSAADDTLPAVLARMDSVAASFKGLTADLKQVSHTDVVNENTIDTGTIAVKKSGPKDTKIRFEIEPPNPKKALISGNKVLVYYPKINTVQEFELGKAASMKDQLMMLAFGSSSRDLLSAYNIKLGGPDSVNGQKATRIELTPKDKDLKAQIPQIELWIADGTGQTLQQKLHQPGGDYVIATYSKIQLGNIPESAVKLDIPGNAKKEKPQK